jgi:ribosomal protein L32
MSALKAAGDITNLMVASHDANVIRHKAIELQTQIFTAQQNAIAAQSDQFALLERVRDLEKQVADLEAWDAEKKRYELKRLTSGALVYSLKTDASGSEPPHQICANCYQHHRKSILQRMPQNIARVQLSMPSMSRCPECKSEIID